MPIAAPDYVNKHKHAVVECPPGHRFLIYFDGWNDGWKIEQGQKATSLRRLLKLGEGKALLGELRARQEALAAQAADDRCLVIDAVTTSPFSTGLGNEHPVENGFAFLTPYGLPYLAGTGVKGVLRHAAEELLSEGVLGLSQVAIDALFGPEDPAALGEGPPLPDEERRRGALSFWDVFPDPKDGELVVEIMTPHYVSYYQGNDSPHEAGQPVPIPFLAVPPGSELRFIVTFEPAWLPKGLAPFDWKAVLDESFKHAFAWLGFGAKTAVGYGALQPDPKAEEERRRKAAEREEKVRLSSLSEQGRQIEALRARLQNHEGKKQPVSGVLYRELNKLMKAALDTPWPDAERKMLADLVADLAFVKIDFQSKEKEVKRQLRQLRGES
jgi:CRISPR-associated protein Cmr6